MKNFIADIIESSDGSGDAILQLPPIFCAEEDWREDDIISIDVENETIVLRNLSKDKREGINRSIP